MLVPVKVKVFPATIRVTHVHIAVDPWKLEVEKVEERQGEEMGGGERRERRQRQKSWPMHPRPHQSWKQREADFVALLGFWGARLIVSEERATETMLLWSSLEHIRIRGLFCPPFEVTFIHGHNLNRFRNIALLPHKGAARFKRVLLLFRRIVVKSQYLLFTDRHEVQLSLYGRKVVRSLDLARILLELITLLLGIIVVEPHHVTQFGKRQQSLCVCVGVGVWVCYTHTSTLQLFVRSCNEKHTRPVSVTLVLALSHAKHPPTHPPS